MVSETQRGDSLASEQLSSQSVCDSHSLSFHKILHMPTGIFCHSRGQQAQRLCEVKNSCETTSRFPAIFLGFIILLLPFLLPQLYLWGSPFWARFLRIEVVTFRLHGQCMLGVFLLPAFTRLGHECQDLLSPCNGMHNYVHRLDLGLHSSARFLGEWSQNPC